MKLTRILVGKLLVGMVCWGTSSCSLPTSESANANNQQTEINEQVTSRGNYGAGWRIVRHNQ